MEHVKSDHSTSGNGLVLTYTPPTGSTAILYGAKVTATAPLASVANEMKIEGLSGGTLYEKINVLNIGGIQDSFNLPSVGVSASGADVDIVLTVPAITGSALAAWMIVEDVTG